MLLDDSPGINSHSLFTTANNLGFSSNILSSKAWIPAVREARMWKRGLRHGGEGWITLFFQS